VKTRTRHRTNQDELRNRTEEDLVGAMEEVFAGSHKGSG
jgi:hypothetical protein